MPDRRTVADLGEDALVRAVVARFPPMPAFVQVGPGDDGAVLDLAGPLVLSTDTLVEGRDFRRDWSTGVDVGVKVAAQSFADVAAMGARPVALLVSLAGPGTLPAGFAEELAMGLDDESRRAGAAVVGGDVSDADAVVITGTALGVLAGRPVLRSGARPGDVVAIAGACGPSAAGLALLSAGLGGERGGADGTPDERRRTASLDRLLAAHRAPRPWYAAGPAAAESDATALIDTSDGLVRDAGRVGDASRVALDLDPEAIRDALGEVLGDLQRAATRLADPGLVDQWIFTGGEDHALLGCFPAGSGLPEGYREIGAVRALVAGASGPGVLVGGRPWPGTPGWRHWR